MSNSIYNVSNWAATTSYQKNDIVVNNSLFYYANLDHISTSSFSTDLANNKFVGMIMDNGENKSYFTWRAAYNHNTENEPRIKKIQFGEGYVQRFSDGINNILPAINLEFECDLNEVTAILHFLTTRAGVESFCWIPPAPYGILSRWVCEKWSNVQPFYNNYKIQAVFQRSVV